MRIRPQHERATGSPQLWWLMTTRRWTPPRPINVYVIEHESGVVLFDTGQDRRSVTDPQYFPGGIVGFGFSRLARFDIGPSDTLTAQLAAIGVEIENVSVAILSHLHQDHIGGLRELAHAEILVSDSELRELDSRGAEAKGLLVDHIRIPGLRWAPVLMTATADPSLAPFESSHDVFGDGTLVLLPTPGHTPGSLSLLLRQDGMPPLLFVGDLSYDESLLAGEHIPGVGTKRQLLASTRAVNELRRRHPGLVVLAAHDPAAAGMLAAALGNSVAS